MGAWGTNIFQNDVSEDVKDDYKNALKTGKSDSEALKEILDNSSDYLEDDEDKFDFWFGLASVMSDLGRLTNEVRDTAVKLIDNGGDLFRFEDSKSDMKKRKAALEKLREKLTGTQPERKKIPVAKAFICSWKTNDIYIFKLDSESLKNKPYFGKYIAILVDETVNYDVDLPLGDMLPVTYLKLCEKRPDSPEEIEKAPFIPRHVFYLGDGRNDKSEREHRFMWYRDGFKKHSKRFELWGNYEFTRPYNKPWTYPAIRNEKDFHTTIACVLSRIDEDIAWALDFYAENL